MTSTIPSAHQPTSTTGDPDPLRAVYRERAHLIATLTTHPGVRWAALTTDPTPALPDCTTVVVLDTTAGQLTWHLADQDLDLVAHLPRVTPADPDVRATWDGHDTDEKYRRLRALTAQATTN